MKAIIFVLVIATLCIVQPALAAQKKLAKKTQKGKVTIESFEFRDGRLQWRVSDTRPKLSLPFVHCVGDTHYFEETSQQYREDVNAVFRGTLFLEPTKKKGVISGEQLLAPHEASYRYTLRCTPGGSSRVVQVRPSDWRGLYAYDKQSLSVTPFFQDEKLTVPSPQLPQLPQLPQPSGSQPYALKEHEILEETYEAAAESIFRSEEPTENSARFISGKTLENSLREKLRVDVTGTSGNVGAHTIVLDWGTSHPSLTWVTYGKTFDEGLEYKNTEYDTGHLVLLEKLEPNTLYYYTLRTQDVSGRQGNIYRWAQKTLPEGSKETSLKTAFFIFPRFPKTYTAPSKGSSDLSVSLNTTKLDEALWNQFNASSEVFLDGMVIEPEALERLTITAKPNEIFMEWSAPPPITNVKISPNVISKVSSGSRDPGNVRMLFGTDSNYGLDMLTGKEVGKPSVPGTNEVGEGFMRFKGLVPGRTYHLHFRARSDLGRGGAAQEIGMRDLAVTTPLSTTSDVTIIKDFPQPALTKLWYPKRVQFPFISFTTDKPSYATLQYNKTSLQQYSATYYDRQLITSNAAYTKHTMQLENLEAKTLYSFELTLSDAPIDVINLPTNTTSSVASPVGAYRQYSFNVLIE